MTDRQNFRVYPQRFWVLFIFALLAFNQTMFWLTFSPIAGPSRIFFNISEATIDLLLNWGPIIFLPTLPFVYLLLNTHHGFRKCVRIFAIVPVVATLLRLFPLIIVSSTSEKFHDIAVLFLHIGQILIALTGPISMALVSQLSCIWFPSHERTRSTTFAILGATSGGAIAFVVEPRLVSEAWHIPRLLYMHTGQAIFVCILTLAYFPAEPPSPPSAAADMLKINHLIHIRPIQRLKKFAFDIFHCCRNLSCILMIISGAIMGGVFAAWGGLFATILAPLGYTEIEAGWFGFGQTVASVIGSIAIGYIADLPRFRRSFKLLILISLTLCFIFCLFFQLSVRTIIWPKEPILPSSSASIGVLLSIIGFFSGATSPLFYESLAEIMYPFPESLTTSILVYIFNIITLCFIAIAPNQYKLMNLLVFLMIGLSILMVTCARITYNRKDEELRKCQEPENKISEDVKHI
ncbi:unnamed protein product [Rotaria magnacalcarata]|nr:unnamed protein product [Rotaria magnacalcarata]CAF1601499.1 unnamed protein product [Rotaria magnacalcarata]CAF1913224.1 unnamed protein product [Rotaria magnacalcarata]CAF1941039.1 unnamed protein product [Rotaria magnacalcarata]